MGSPDRRETQGDGVAIVLRERESRLPGEGRQVSGDPTGEVREMRTAETVLGIIHERGKLIQRNTATGETLESRVLRKA